MPWSNNSGGPWGNGPSGGGNGGGPRNPWGQGPKRGGGGGGNGGGGGGGPQPPDLDELFRQSQERLRKTFGGGGGGFSKIGLGIAGVALVAAYLFLSFYQVQEGENAVITRLGAYHSTTGPGPHFAIWPIDDVTVVARERENRVDIGFRSSEGGVRVGAQRAVPSEGLMLAGDENIIDIQFAVLWRIADPQAYLFNIVAPEETVKAVAESAMREVAGLSEAEFIRGRGRQQVTLEVQKLIQETLDSYGAGILVTRVELDKADPPPRVIDAFRDVQAAQQDQERLKNEADRYFNEKVAGARGESRQMLEQAEAYRARVVAEAQGEAARFASIYTQYRAAPEVIRERMYLETMERVLGGMDKIILDEGTGGAGQGVVPYLPLNNLTRDRGTQ